MHRTDHDDDPDDRLQLLRLLLADRDWRCDPQVGRLLRGFLAEPPVAQEAAWRALAEELANYVAFRRLGQCLAHCAGGPRAGLRFTRADWEALRDEGLSWPDYDSVAPGAAQMPSGHRTAAAQRR